MKNYISLEPNKVYVSLRREISKDLINAQKLIKELELSERYINDHEFRNNIETSKVLITVKKGNHKEAIARLEELIDITIALRLWYLLSTNLLLMGNSYFYLGLFERALEQYYRIIENEKKRHFLRHSSAAYNNIALIFIDSYEYKKGIEYLKLSLDANIRDDNIALYREKNIFAYGNLIKNYSKFGDYYAMEEAHGKLLKLKFGSLTVEEKYLMELAEMHYNFAKKNYTLAKEAYIRAKEFKKFLPEDTSILMTNFVNEAIEHGLDYDFYIEELLELDEIGLIGDTKEIDKRLIALLGYYELKGDLSNLARSKTRYNDFIKNQVHKLEEKQLESIKIVESILSGIDKREESEYEAKEIEMIAKEATRSHEKLQSAYEELENIHDIGIKLTSSFQLDEVIGTIYENIRKRIVFDEFTLAAVDKTTHRLNSLINYRKGILAPDFSLDLNEENSVLVKVVKENAILTSESDFFQNLLREDKVMLDGDLIIMSFAFLPIEIKGETIGAYAIQKEEDIPYTQKEIEFLKALHPYIAIAINNALHQNEMENEIRKHIDAKKKLVRANERLNKAIRTDSLTKIKNRKGFLETYNKLIKRAVKLGQTITISMFDIDDFKIYNDTYGHFFGDRVLIKVAEVLEKHFSMIDGDVARFGGEEFIGITIGLNEDESLNHVNGILEETRALGINNPKSPLGVLTISAGLAISFNPETIDLNLIIDRADDMLYKSKKSGKNRALINRMD